MSKFDKIFEARETQENTPKKETRVTSKSKDNSLPIANIATEKKESDIKHSPEPTSRRRGRPQAKRSDPNYVGFTTYIRKDTHLNVKIALLQESKGRELSELVEDLLRDWIKKKQK